MGKWVHVLETTDAEARTGVCRACGPVKLIAKEAGKLRCANAIKSHPSRQRGTRKPDADPRSPHHGLRKRTMMWVRTMYGKKGCWICGSFDRLVIDHDHRTGRIRGVLCNRHNLVIGWFNDDPDMFLRVVEYLRHPPIDKDPAELDSLCHARPR